MFTDITPVVISKELADMSGLFKDDYYYLLNENRTVIAHGIKVDGKVNINRIILEDINYDYLKRIETISLLDEKKTIHLYHDLIKNLYYINRVFIPKNLISFANTDARTFLFGTDTCKEYKISDHYFFEKLSSFYKETLPFQKDPF